MAALAITNPGLTQNVYRPRAVYLCHTSEPEVGDDWCAVPAATPTTPLDDVVVQVDGKWYGLGKEKKVVSTPA